MHSDIESLTQGILNQDIGALARSITLTESMKPKHRQQAKQLLEAIQPHTGQALRIGITGTPGVGKSTFIDTFASTIIETYSKSIAVLVLCGVE